MQGPGIGDTDEPEKKLIVQSEEQPAAHFRSQLFPLPLREPVGRLRNQKHCTHTFFVTCGYLKKWNIRIPLSNSLSYLTATTKHLKDKVPKLYSEKTENIS